MAHFASGQGNGLSLAVLQTTHAWPKAAVAQSSDAIPKSTCTASDSVLRQPANPPTLDMVSTKICRNGTFYSGELDSKTIEFTLGSLYLTKKVVVENITKRINKTTTCTKD